MEKLVFKNKVQRVVEILLAISLFLIVTTIESEWTLTYIIFLGINLLVFIITNRLLNKYGKY